MSEYAAAHLPLLQNAITSGFPASSANDAWKFGIAHTCAGELPADVFTLCLQMCSLSMKANAGFHNACMKQKHAAIRAAILCLQRPLWSDQWLLASR